MRSVQIRAIRVTTRDRLKHAALILALALPVAALANGEPASDPPAAAPQAAPGMSLDMPSYETPAQKWGSAADAKPTLENCRDRIREVRDETGLPKLEPVTPAPEVIYAVDRRQDGCSVLVVKGNPNDIRPLPETQNGPLFRPIPAD